jgi:Delta24(24(1))-sterol reductase
MQDAWPTLNAWIFYWTFVIVEGVFYVTLPGIQVQGLPLKHLNNRRLDYYCNALWSFYLSVGIALTLHFTGLFKLTFLIDHFGSIMSVAIISGFVVSIIVFTSSFLKGTQHRMTGHWIYDFFMGAPLNPRIGKWFDMKMFAEVRVPWFILFFITLAATLRQYETYGYVTPQMGINLLGHYLYANACAKGEELIVPTWYPLLRCAVMAGIWRLRSLDLC